MNTSELRRKILEDWEALRSGTQSVGEARARAALLKPLIDLMKLELLHEAMDRPSVQPIAITDDDDERKVIGLPRR